MAHRHVSVYSLSSLASAVEGQVLKPEQQRESALKFLTRAIACMVDGKGLSSLMWCMEGGADGDRDRLGEREYRRSDRCGVFRRGPGGTEPEVRV